MRELIQAGSREHGTTFFLSSHILSEVEKICDRVGILHQGRLLRAGRVAELTGSEQKRCLVRVGNADVAVAVISEAGWDVTTQTLPKASHETGVRMEVSVSDAEIPRLMRFLSAGYFDVYEARPFVKSLEDVFREMVASA